MTLPIHLSLFCVLHFFSSFAISDEYKSYWETTMFLQIEEFYSWGGLEETFSGYYDSSSPDGPQSSAASKNIVSERNRRKKLNDRLFALRAVVPILRDERNDCRTRGWRCKGMFSGVDCRNERVEVCFDRKIDSGEEEQEGIHKLERNEEE